MAKTKKAGIHKAPTRTQQPPADGHAAGRKAAAASASAPIPLDRRASVDRRGLPDRRKAGQPVAVERRKLQRRVKVNRRRQIDPTTCERDYTDQEIEFMSALDAYKRSSGRMFPTCSEILEVIRNLGYEKRLGDPSAAMPAHESTPAEPGHSEPAGFASRDDGSVE